jgi:hypothetical protein
LGRASSLGSLFSAARIGDIIAVGMSERRSSETALADLCARYPTAELARMIRQLLAEIGERKRRS